MGRIIDEEDNQPNEDQSILTTQSTRLTKFLGLDPGQPEVQDLWNRTLATPRIPTLSEMTPFSDEEALTLSSRVSNFLDMVSDPVKAGWVPREVFNILMEQTDDVNNDFDFIDAHALESQVHGKPIWWTDNCYKPVRPGVDREDGDIKATPNLEVELAVQATLMAYYQSITTQYINGDNIKHLRLPSVRLRFGSLGKKCPNNHWKDDRFGSYVEVRISFSDYIPVDVVYTSIDNMYNSYRTTINANWWKGDIGKFLVQSKTGIGRETYKQLKEGAAHVNVMPSLYQNDKVLECMLAALETMQVIRHWIHLHDAIKFHFKAVERNLFSEVNSGTATKEINSHWNFKQYIGEVVKVLGCNFSLENTKAKESFQGIERLNSLRRLKEHYGKELSINDNDRLYDLLHLVLYPSNVGEENRLGILLQEQFKLVTSNYQEDRLGIFPEWDTSEEE